MEKKQETSQFKFTEATAKRRKGERERERKETDWPLPSHLLTTPKYSYVSPVVPSY
jgi:hypothetical protein